MRGEFHGRISGPKKAAIRKLITTDTDFLFLTETRVHVSDVKKFKIKGMAATHYSLQALAGKGVIIYSKHEHKIMEGSLRESQTPGHIAAAVYEIHKSRTVVIGIYGCSQNDDRISPRLIAELDTIASELKHLFNTQHLIIGGDFNVVLTPQDSSSNILAKPRTTARLLALMDKHHLLDAASTVNDTRHTWHRKNMTQSSRLDMILTNIPMDNLRYSSTISIFDHSWLTATFGQLPSKHTPTMKDYILGTDEYLIHTQELLDNIITAYGTRREVIPQEEEEEGPTPTRDKNIDVSNPVTGRTTMYVFNQIIQDLQKKHHAIAKQKRETLRQSTHLISSRLYQQRRALKRTNDPAELEGIHDQINAIQRDLSNDLEAKEQASQMRISNFYKTETGKMVPTTFHCIKEKNLGKKIQQLEHEGRVITDQEEIVTIMQQWYEQTAERALPQTLSLPAFLATHNVVLPQISDEHKEMLEEEFSVDEVRDAINDANAISAPGPSGQNITFYKLLFHEIPHIMTRALNELVFVPTLDDFPQFEWIKHRKVIYIPKKPHPITPSDYRPLSMLEVLYKIPSRILACRLTRILPTIIGPHQHGFMPQKGIQEPSILATHLIQEAGRYQKPLQLVSFDIEKAFDRVSHKIILDALRAFGVPEITIMAIQHFTLVGYAFVEVNGRQGLIITIRTGSGQGDPLSSILFLIATEPLNKVLAANFPHLMYTTESGLTVGPNFFADDNLNHLSILDGEGLQEYLAVYGDYQSVSGLNINMNKSQSLCINTSPAVMNSLHQLGIATPRTLKHLGIHLCNTIEETVEVTMGQIEAKAIKRRISATTPPTDLLHRATLINTALIPIYNHVFMALPTTKQQGKDLYGEILSFLWTKQEDGETKQKRRLIAKHRIPASHHMGGLQVQHPMEHASSLRLNLIHKIWQSGHNNFLQSRLPGLLHDLLILTNRQSLDCHVQNMGPTQWDTTGQRLREHNLLLSQSFHSMAKFLRLYENHKTLWTNAAIYGHSNICTMPLSAVEQRAISDMGLVTVSQLFDTQDNGQLSNQNHPGIFATLEHQHPDIGRKLRWLTSSLRRNQRLDTFPSPVTTAYLLMQLDTKPSSKYRKETRVVLDKSIGTAPAYDTRIRDGVYYPNRNTFSDAYKVMEISAMPSKTKETTFQVLNRTIWTNNKAFKSGVSNTDACTHCEEPETMEHLIYGCAHYSALVWREFSTLLTEAVKQYSLYPDIPRMNFTPLEIIFNHPHPSILLHVSSKRTRLNILHLVQEIKRDIIYRRMNMTGTGNPVPQQRIHAHILSIIKKHTALMEYQGFTEETDLMKLMQALIENIQIMIV